jgi:hypothetical protein
MYAAGTPRIRKKRLPPLMGPGYNLRLLYPEKSAGQAQRRSQIHMIMSDVTQ